MASARNARGFVAPLAVFLASFAIDAPRVCRSVTVLGDSATFTAAALVWGVPQPSGYPLFTLVGHAFASLPLGDPAWRVNLTSALFHAATAGVVALMVERATRSWVAAVASGLFLAFTSGFFFGSLYAEAFPLNDLLAAVALALALEIDRAGAAPAPASSRLLAWLAATLGLGAAHHQMLALLVPSLAVLVAPPVARIARSRPRTLARVALVFVVVAALGNALTLLAASRDPAVSWGDVRDLASLARLVSRADYGGLASPALTTAGGHATDRALLFVTSTWHTFGALGAALSALGAVAVWRASKRVALALLLGVAVAGPLFAMMNALPIADARGAAFLARFFTMAHVVLAVLVGYGVAWVESFAAARGATPWTRAAIGMVWLVPLASHSAACDLRADRTGAALVHDLERPIDAGALVLVAGDDLVGAATYACAVDHFCDTRAMFSPGQLHMPWRAAQIARRYPTLRLAPREGRPPRASELVVDNATRPLYLAASLLDLNPSVRALPVGFLPSGLLLRVVADDDVPRFHASLLADANGMLAGEACETCALGPRASPLEDGVVAIAATSLENHARILRFVMDAPDEAAPLESRAALLRAPSAPGD